MWTGDQSRELNVVSARPNRNGTLFQLPGELGPAAIAIGFETDRDRQILCEAGVRGN